MAYSYGDFVNAATASGLMDQFDDDDLATAQLHPEYGLSLLSLKRDYGKANTEEQKLLINTAADKLRSSYGVGTTGSTSSATSGTQSSTGINTGAANFYSAGTGSTGSAATDTSGSFASNQTAAAGAGTSSTTSSGSTWDADTDPAYQAYRKQYLTNANRATSDALGQYAAASAGRPSSYAVNAATQAGDYYVNQLAGQVPTLYQTAYDNAATEKANNYSNLTSLITSTGYQPTEDEISAAGMNDEMVEALYRNWAASYPDQAYATGGITADQYYQLTGEWPIGYDGTTTGTSNGLTYDADLAAVQQYMINNGMGGSMMTSQIGYNGSRTKAAMNALTDEQVEEIYEATGVKVR